MHIKGAKLTFITMSLLLLVTSTGAISGAVSSAEVAFAKYGRYTGDSTSQAAALNNECLNSILDSNTIDNMVGVGNCSGTISQQDESGSAAAPITHQSADPTIELQRSTTTQSPPTEEPPGPEEPQGPNPFGTCLAGAPNQCGRVHFGATCNG